MDFHERLKQAMSRRGVSQSALAQHLEVSAASVSSWCSGAKRPATSNLEKIADVLGVTPGFLQFGDGSSAEPDDSMLEALRSQYRTDLKWYWRPGPRDRGREYGNAAAYAFETDIPNLGRESAQNISDEKLDTVPTVDAFYTVSELSGRHLDTFLESIRFDEIRPHLEASRGANRKAGNVIDRGLEQLDSGRLISIKIEDFGANGLTGPEFDPGRYMAVVRNILDSQKGETAGGSYGLGWATFPSTSQFGLVLCNSTLSLAEQGRTENRFVGVIDLPWHIVDGKDFAGRGWYGAEDPMDSDPEPPTISYWDNEALVRDAHLYRPDRRPGTSFLIVGAYDPSGSLDEIEDIAERFSESLADNFWPAMVDRSEDQPARLRVVVRAERNGQRVVENYVNPAHYQPARVGAFEKHLNDDVVETLEELGDVVRRNVTLRVPRRAAEPSHDPYEHEASLLIVQADDAGRDREAEAPGTVTFIRGSHMVIQQPKVGALPIGARAFHAIVLAGEAAGDAAADRAADRFLRAAEPPAHNKWGGTSEITASYARGGKAAIAAFEAEVKKIVREVIRQTSQVSDDGPEALKELIRIIPPTPNGKRPRVKSVRAHEVNSDGAWVITEATVTLPARKDRQGWTISPVLRFGTESGAPIAVRWLTIEPGSRCALDDRGRLVTPPSARTATFTAITDPSSHPVGAHRAKVLVDVRVHAGVMVS